MRTLLALAAFGLLAGCAAPAADPTLTTSRTDAVHEEFAGSGLPAGWQVHMGTWEPSASHGELVMRGAGAKEPGLSSLVADGEFGGFEASTRFLMESGEHPQGAGLVFDWQDAKNYQIVRYSISENGWNLFTVRDGNRDKVSSATVPNGTNPALNEWVHLRIVQDGRHVQAFDNATLVIDHMIPAGHPAAGRLGLFVRGDTVASFDALHVVPR